MKRCPICYDRQEFWLISPYDATCRLCGTVIEKYNYMGREIEK